MRTLYEGRALSHLMNVCPRTKSRTSCIAALTSSQCFSIVARIFGRRNFGTSYRAPCSNRDKHVFRTKSRVKSNPYVFRDSRRASSSSVAAFHPVARSENNKSDLPSFVPPEFALMNTSTTSSSV